jgi:branched-chain amino acid transport system substrate-binding protein
MTLRRRVRAGAIAALAASCLVLCRAAGFAADPQPVEVAVVLSQTGQGAFLGSQIQQSMMLAQDYTNKTGGIRGRPIKFVFYDDQTNPQVANQIFNQFKAKNTNVVLGPSMTAPCLAAAPIVQSSGPVELCSSPALHPTHGSYVFSMSPAVFDFLAVYVRYFRLNGWHRIGLITSADATGQDVERQLAEVLSLPENANMKLVESDRFALADINVSAQMARLRSANCDSIIAWTTGAPWGTLVHGINDAGIQVPIAASPGNMVNAQMERMSSILPPSLIFAGVNGMVRNALRPGPVLDAQKAYYASLDGAHVHGDFGDLIAWDSTMIVVDALRHLGPDATADQVRSYILGLHGWSGVEGVYDFSDREQRGVGQNALFIAKWDPSEQGWVALSRPGGYLK